MPAPLSDKEYRGFWVKWNDGTIEVGKEGVAQSFMSYNGVRHGYGYYGVNTSEAAKGHWYIEGISSLNTAFQVKTNST